MTLNNILAVGAHPDDIEFGCGGTIAKHSDLGDEVHLLIMTNGEKGNHSPNREECMNSLKVLGIKNSDIIFGNFPDGFLVANNHTVNFIEQYINKFNINRVYTHFYDDWHQDHRNCSYVVASAARRISEIFLFQSYSTNASFEPHYFIELSEKQLDKKINALNCYKTQIKKGSVNLKLIENLASINGAKGNVKYAEAFVINHLFKRGKNV